jgi:hypothetical protein
MRHAQLRHNVFVAVHPEAIPPSATPEEAAAIVAALERFMRATAPVASAGAASTPDGWHAAALLEGVARDPWGALADPASGASWINT